LPPEETFERVCADAILRDNAEALYLLGMRSKALAEAERAEMTRKLETDRWVGNTAHRHEADAVLWFTRACHRHVGATFEVGVAKLHGRGIAQAIDEGLGLIEYAAELGHADAQHLFAVYILEGHAEDLQDVPRDFERARLLLEQAANQEHP